MPDTEPRGLRASIEALAGERLRVHGPHVECNNKGCRDRHLSGLHCGDPCEEAHEDCGDWRAWSQVRALLNETTTEGTPLFSEDEAADLTRWLLRLASGDGLTLRQEAQTQALRFARRLEQITEPTPSSDEWEDAFCRVCGWLPCECDADDKPEPTPDHASYTHRQDIAAGPSVDEANQPRSTPVRPVPTSTGYSFPRQSKYPPKWRCR
jgi:hypothetical protein